MNLCCSKEASIYSFENAWLKLRPDLLENKSPNVVGSNPGAGIDFSPFNSSLTIG